MSVNSSNSSLRFYNVLLKCFNSKDGSLNFIISTITSIFFILPLCILVLYLGHRRWRQQPSGAAISHSDLFTYHMVINELLTIFGLILSCCAILTDLPEMMMPGVFIFSINASAQTFFHILTCVERYLAVVHPVIYMGLKKTRGIRIRNITIGCVWLLCFSTTGFMFIENDMCIAMIFLCVTAFPLIIISFFSISVLCALIRPGPGEGGGGGSRQQVHQSKLKAFYTIMAILGVLSLRLGQNIITANLLTLPQLGETGRCALWLSTYWFSLPSSLVLPLLFLYRAGKLPCCKSNTGSGSE